MHRVGLLGNDDVCPLSGDHDVRRGHGELPILDGDGLGVIRIVCHRLGAPAAERVLAVHVAIGVTRVVDACGGVGRVDRDLGAGGKVGLIRRQPRSVRRHVALGIVERRTVVRLVPVPLVREVVRAPLPGERERREAASLGICGQGEDDVVSNHLALDGRDIAQGNLILELVAILAVQALEVVDLEALRVGVGRLGRDGPVDGHVLVARDPGVAVILIHEVQVLELSGVERELLALRETLVGVVEQELLGRGLIGSGEQVVKEQGDLRTRFAVAEKTEVLGRSVGVVSRSPIDHGDADAVGGVHLVGAAHHRLGNVNAFVEDALGLGHVAHGRRGPVTGGDGDAEAAGTGVIARSHELADVDADVVDAGNAIVARSLGFAIECERSGQPGEGPVVSRLRSRDLRAVVGECQALERLLVNTRDGVADRGERGLGERAASGVRRHALRGERDLDLFSPVDDQCGKAELLVARDGELAGSGVDGVDCSVTDVFKLVFALNVAVRPARLDDAIRACDKRTHADTTVLIGCQRLEAGDVLPVVSHFLLHLDRGAGNRLGRIARIHHTNDELVLARDTRSSADADRVHRLVASDARELVGALMRRQGGGVCDQLAADDLGIVSLELDVVADDIAVRGAVLTEDARVSLGVFLSATGEVGVVDPVVVLGAHVAKVAEERLGILVLVVVDTPAEVLLVDPLLELLEGLAIALGQLGHKCPAVFSIDERLADSSAALREVGALGNAVVAVPLVHEVVRAFRQRRDCRPDRDGAYVDEAVVGNLIRHEELLVRLWDAIHDRCGAVEVKRADLTPTLRP